MSDHSAGYMLNDFISKVGERGIIDFDRHPEAVGMLVRLANDLVEWEMSHGNPRRAYVQDANCYEIAGKLPDRHHFCQYCGHGLDAPLEHDYWACGECEEQRPNTWRNTGRPPPS